MNSGGMRDKLADSVPFVRLFRKTHVGQSHYAPVTIVRGHEDLSLSVHQSVCLSVRSSYFME